MKRLSGACVLLLFVCAGAGATELYYWKDARGVSHYSETPPEGRRYELRRVDARGGPPAPAAAPAPAESAECLNARKNLEVLGGSGKVMQDTDGDGKPDTALDAQGRADQKNLAEAAARAYCRPPAAG